MNIDIARTIIDFGAVILIWMVQLVVYPSFIYFSEKDLIKWHIPYTQQITYVVAPIMFSQTGIIAYQNWTNYNLLNAISAVICLTLWILTFKEAVPLHHKIDLNQEVRKSSKDLIRINKKRTALWTILFLISVSQLILKGL